MSVARRIVEERRWWVLQAIAEMADRRLNEDAVRSALKYAGRPNNAEDIRNDLLLLERAGCVTVDRMPRGSGELWVAELTAEGLQVRDCEREVSGVAARRPF